MTAPSRIPVIARERVNGNSWHAPEVRRGHTHCRPRPCRPPSRRKAPRSAPQRETAPGDGAMPTPGP